MKGYSSTAQAQTVSTVLCWLIAARHKDIISTAHSSYHQLCMAHTHRGRRAGPYIYSETQAELQTHTSKWVSSKQILLKDCLFICRGLGDLDYLLHTCTHMHTRARTRKHGNAILHVTAAIVQLKRILISCF